MGAVIGRFAKGTSTGQLMTIKTTGRSFPYYSGMNANANNDATIVLQIFANMTAGDTAIVELTVSGGTKSVGYFSGSTLFYGYLAV